MKVIILTVIAILASFCLQAQVDLGEFTMSDISSPAFLLVEESPTEIYTPDNVRALALHASENFGNSLSVEVSPYFFMNTQSPYRTYYRYIGVHKDESGTLKQNPFSGLNTTTVSFSYVNKEFEGLGDGDRKTYAIGLRTTLLRFFNKQKIYDNAQAIANELQNLTVPNDVLAGGAEAIKKYYLEQQKVEEKFAKYQKTIKPLFRLDGALGYATLFKENDVSSSTAKRFGSWLTAQGSFILNEGNSGPQNNYLNLFVTARYIEDGFQQTEALEYNTLFYRDLGGKVEMELGKLAFAYEFIQRHGEINSERSVGSIKFIINKDISLSGGFGKDFEETDNLITVFGINWGLNLGGKALSFQ